MYFAGPRTFVFILAFSIASPAFAATVLNDVIAVVANAPVTSIDLVQELDRLKKRKAPAKDKRGPKSQAVDNLIGRAIIDVIAREESVTISPERIKNAIKKEMDMRGILREEDFKKVIKRDTGMEFDDYKDELSRQLKTQQVMQLRVSVPNPTPSQVEEWYRQNKNRVGKKYTFRMIYIPVAGNELKVSNQMKAARAMGASSSAGFAGAAAKYSAHASKGRGGLMVDMRLDQVAQIDPILAGAINGTPMGTTSQIFVGSNGGIIALGSRAQGQSVLTRFTTMCARLSIARTNRSNMAAGSKSSARKLL
jgi:putative peptidyl-prolyl cis-trans isomerase